MADAQVLALIKHHNKPFNAVGVGDFLASKGIKKAAVQKALDSLAAAGKLTAKEFGKTKIYLPPQDGLEVLSNEDLDAKKTELRAAQQELAEEQGRLKEKEDELRGWQSSLTAEQLREQVVDLKAKTEAQAAKLSGLRSGASLVTAEERAAVEKALSSAVDACRKRRSIFRGVWDTVSENMEGKQSDLFDEIGVDTDEAAGVNFQDIINLLPGAHPAAKRRKL